MYRFFAVIIVVLALLQQQGCRSKDEEPSRGYRMGFQNSGPRPQLNDYIRSLNEWTTRADAAMITTEVPWNELLQGQSVVSYVTSNYSNLVQVYRSKNFPIWIFIDPQNGLDRTTDAVALVNRNKSIADADMQALYQRFVIVMDSILKPEHIGLALETNLIRVAASRAIYDGVKKAANRAAQELKAKKSLAKISISVQAEEAWGKFGNQIFKGIAQDRADFPFAEEMGISSYPYLAFDKPSDMPSDYYDKLMEGISLPRFVSEGGWSSAPTASVGGSSQHQAEYFRLHHQQLQRVGAIAWFQLLYTDIDPTSFPPPVPANLVFFTSIGIVDVNFQPKPVQAVWDELFKLPLKN